MEGQASFDEFSLAVQSATASFQLISQEVKAVIAAATHPIIAGMMQDIQDAEKQKLSVAVRIMEDKSETVFGQRDMSTDVAQSQQTLRKLLLDINQRLEELQEEYADEQ